MNEYDHASALRFKRTLLYTAHWDELNGAGAEDDPANLRVSSVWDGSDQKREWCAAFRFDTEEAPWNDTTDGLFASMPSWCSLLVYINEYACSAAAGDGNIPTLTIYRCAATHPFTTGMTEAQLSTMLSNATSGEATTLHEGWIALVIQARSDYEYGFVVALDEPGHGSVSDDFQARIAGVDSGTPPVHFIHNATALDMTLIDTHSYYETDSRIDVNTRAQAALSDRRQGVRIEIGATLSHAGDPAYGSQDIASRIQSNSSVSLVRERTSIPAMWDPSPEDPGAIITDKGLPSEDWTGDAIDFTLSCRIGQMLHEIRTIRGYVQRVSETHKDKQMALVGVGTAYGDMPVCKTVPEAVDYPQDYESGSVTPTTLTIALDALNGLQVSLLDLYPADLAWLYLRTAGMHCLRTWTAEQLEGMTFASLLADSLSILGLGIGWHGSKAVIWNPCWYRPSMRAWEDVDLDADNITYSFIRRRDDLIRSLSVSYEDDPNSITQTMYPAIPYGMKGLAASTLDLSYEDGTAPGFHSIYPCNSKRGLLGYLSALAAYDYEILEITFDRRGLLFKTGDKLLISSEREEYDDEVFTVFQTATGLTDNAVQIQAVRWPSWEASKSLYSDTSRLIGVWRWAMHDDDSTRWFFGGNMLPWGTDWDMEWIARTVGVIGPPRVKPGSWQGALLRVDAPTYERFQLIPDGTSIPAGYVPTDEDIDTYELQVGVYGNLEGIFLSGSPVTEWYPYVLRIYDSSANEYDMVLGIHLGIDAGISLYPSSTRSKWFFGVVDGAYTSGVAGKEYDASTPWKVLIEAPMGVEPGTIDLSWSPENIRIESLSSLAIAWGTNGDGRNIYRFYIDGVLMGEADAGYTTEVLTYDRIEIQADTGSGGYITVGALRQWKSPESGDNVPLNELCGPNGVDPYYP